MSFISSLWFAVLPSMTMRGILFLFLFIYPLLALVAFSCVIFVIGAGVKTSRLSGLNFAPFFRFLTIFPIASSISESDPSVSTWYWLIMGV